MSTRSRILCYLNGIIVLQYPKQVIIPASQSSLVKQYKASYFCCSECLYLSSVSGDLSCKNLEFLSTLELLCHLSRDNLKHFYLPNLSHHFKLLSHICVPCPRSYLGYATLISTFYYYYYYYYYIVSQKNVPPLNCL